ncbi:unnamed protein product, partial [Rotaria sordida]
LCYSIQFHSILILPSISLQLLSSQSYERFILENRLNYTYEDRNDLPILNWKYLTQTLRPNKHEISIFHCVYKILTKNDVGDYQALVNLTLDADTQPQKNEQERKAKPAKIVANKMTGPIFGDKPKETPNHGDKVQIQCKVTGSLALEIT